MTKGENISSPSATDDISMTWRRLVRSVAVAIGAALGHSQALAVDPSTAECLAANEASLKSANEHRLRQERSELLICAAASCPSDIRQECIRRIDELNAAIPTIIFGVKDASGNDVSAVKVSMDGQLLAERLDGSALSVDPGAHTFVFEKAGQSTVTKQFVIREAQKNRHEAITLGSQAVSATTASTAFGAQKTLAIVAGGVGIVGLGVGSAFGLVAMAKKNEAQRTCPDDECADQRGVHLWDDAARAGDASTVAFIVGGAMLVGGATLWLTARPSSNRAPTAQVGIGPGSIQLKGVW
jgi:hypothetical protein